MATTKRIKKAVPAKIVVKFSEDGSPIIPLDVRRKMDENLKLREELNELKKQLDASNEDILIFVDATKKDTLEYGNAKFTRVQGTKSVMDEDALKADIGTAMFTKISERVVNKDLLKTAIADGKIAVKAVSDATTISNNKPYLKVTKA